MNRNLLFFFLYILIIGCTEDNDEVGKAEVNPEEIKAEQIFIETGCKPKDIRSIKKMWLFVDSVKNERFLYGSKIKNGIESFWISKFASNGEQVWEIIKEQENSASHACKPYIISTGDLVFQKVLQVNDIEKKEASPAIVNSKDGSTKFIEVFDGYFYSDIYAYKDFFFCSISQEELQSNSRAKKHFAQIDNEGNILNQAPEMNIPENFKIQEIYNTIWKGYNTFIIATPTYIYKRNVSLTYKEPSWDYTVSLPEHTKCTPTGRLDKDTVIVNYDIKRPDGKEDTYTCKLLYSTGELVNDEEPNPDNPNAYKYMDLNKPHIAPDSMTVTLHSIDISDNGQGTTYYTINYTLENNTKDMIILEGTFEAFLPNNKKGEYQTGFFDKIYPGELINRSYTFKSLSKEPYLFIQYKHDWMGNDADILKKSLKWKITP